MTLKPNHLLVPSMLIAAAVAMTMNATASAQQLAQAAQKPAPASPTAQATLLGQFGDWGAYTATPGGRKVCFILSKPTASTDNPPNRRTAAHIVYMFVSTRPAEKVKEEVSMLVTGYALKGDATLNIGPTAFTMYTQNDGAWVKNSSDETRLVDAMRKGADMVVKATTTRGTQTTDTFSLKGVSQALDRVAQECS